MVIKHYKKSFEKFDYEVKFDFYCIMGNMKINVEFSITEKNESNSILAYEVETKSLNDTRLHFIDDTYKRSGLLVAMQKNFLEKFNVNDDNSKFVIKENALSIVTLSKTKDLSLINHLLDKYNFTLVSSLV